MRDTDGQKSTKKTSKKLPENLQSIKEKIRQLLIFNQTRRQIQSSDFGPSHIMSDRFFITRLGMELELPVRPASTSASTSNDNNALILKSSTSSAPEDKTPSSRLATTLIKERLELLQEIEALENITRIIKDVIHATGWIEIKPKTVMFSQGNDNTHSDKVMEIINYTRLIASTQASSKRLISS